MDMLFRRYANPMVFMNGMIKARRFTEFVDELLKLYKEDKEEEKEKILWDLWLHRVFDKTFSDFVRSQDDDNSAAPPTQEETIEIVRESWKILNSFVPERKEVGDNDRSIPAAGDSGNRCEPGSQSTG